ncbi:Aromatic ring-opening dioxygenase, catalytic subunit, LigB family [Andreprevotia lacus DSM 23236]|jgi:4,5-DOPA dioxygenase extradiol|uniref:Aromatic ring-opening dioxygenase, catalytic subunit, LigB family n=1 Tax=Andreprevotia lacus DSM 23236 TaxID=1121001 RepID=A0A1W1X5J4_9NEIS|nr:class III extradiol ring-cleavage dioxygenase [Andreprevotia lacus]SMC19186.1 Aromatic ring-opening dioxygenase, catalytic subunit, LigB family [Andreprevotia lacus DSM 23236]
MTRLPTVFVSHGSPMLALGAGATGTAWHSLAQSLPKPRAIVVFSAHWSAPTPVVGTAASHDTIHDFGGFPAPLYEVRYDTQGDPELALQLAKGLQDAGWPVRVDDERGLDHGAWVPLKDMYPDAEVPVVPITINSRQSPAWHYQLGQALTTLLPDDVLLVASGSLTHNLYEIEWGHDGEAAPPYVTAFQEWFHDRLQAGDVEALLDYRARAPEAARAHPTQEHLLPIYVALGAAGERPAVTRHFAAVTERILAMDVYSFAAA